jgi:hypothetical protein
LRPGASPPPVNIPIVFNIEIATTYWLSSLREVVRGIRRTRDNCE